LLAKRHRGYSWLVKNSFAHWVTFRVDPNHTRWPSIGSSQGGEPSFPTWDWPECAGHYTWLQIAARGICPPWGISLL